MRQKKNNSVKRNEIAMFSFNLAFRGEKLLLTSAPGNEKCVTSKYLHNRILPRFPRKRKGDIF